MELEEVINNKKREISRNLPGYDLTKFEKLVSAYRQMPEIVTTMAEEVKKVAIWTLNNELTDSTIDILLGYKGTPKGAISVVSAINYIVHNIKTYDTVKETINLFADLKDKPDVAETLVNRFRKIILTTDKDSIKLLLEVYGSKEFIYSIGGLSKNRVDKMIEPLEYLTELTKNSETVRKFISMLAKTQNGPEEAERISTQIKQALSVSKQVKLMSKSYDDKFEVIAKQYCGRFDEKSINGAIYAAIKGSESSEISKGLEAIVSKLEDYKNGFTLFKSVVETVKKNCGKAALSKPAIEFYASDRFKSIVENVNRDELGHILGDTSEIISLTASTDAANRYLDLRTEYTQKDMNKIFKIHSELVYGLSRNTKNVFFSIIYELGPKFEKFVYEEFNNYLARDKQDNGPKMAALVRAEREFLRAQSSENVFPLATMISMLESEQIKKFEKIVNSSPLASTYLTQAWGIAQSETEKRGGVDYLNIFFNSMKEILDNNPKNLSKWAQTIVGDFKKDDVYSINKAVRKVVGYGA